MWCWLYFDMGLRNDTYPVHQPPKFRKPENVVSRRTEKAGSERRFGKKSKVETGVVILEKSEKSDSMLERG